MFRWTFVVVSVMPACVDDVAETGRPSSGSREWVYVSEDTGAPGYDPLVFRADLDTLVAALPTFEPAPLIAAYKAARTNGDAACPPESSLDTEEAYLTWWYGGCKTSAATHFNGVMTAWEWSGQDLSRQAVADLPDTFMPGFAWYGEGFEGRIDIYDEADTFDFSCSCEAVLVNGVATDGNTARVAYVRAPAAWDGPGGHDTWLQVDGRLGSWLLSEMVNVTTGVHTYHGNGSITGPGERFRGLMIELGAEATVEEGVPVCRAVSGTATVWEAETGLTEILTFEQDASVEGCVACADVEGEYVCFDAAPLLRTEGE